MILRVTSVDIRASIIVINGVIEVPYSEVAAKLAVDAWYNNYPVARLVNSFHYRGVIDTPGWKPMEY